MPEQSKRPIIYVVEARQLDGYWDVIAAERPYTLQAARQAARRVYRDHPYLLWRARQPGIRRTVQLMSYARAPEIIFAKEEIEMDGVKSLVSPRRDRRGVRASGSWTHPHKSR